MDEFICPRCQGNGFRKLELPNWALMHWLINPVFCVNEILLGQRMPRVIYFCIKCDLPLVLRQYIKCPTCCTFHRGLIWGKGNAFGHWFGLFCPTCGSQIPTLYNIISIFIILITAPVWLILWRIIRRRWIAYEQLRAKKVSEVAASEQLPVKNWLRWGTFSYGLFMWVAWCIFQYFVRINPTSTIPYWLHCIIMLPIWLLCGAGFGFIMKIIMTRRHKWKKGYCRNCNYSLQGLPIDRCPECGFKFDYSDRSLSTDTE